MRRPSGLAPDVAGSGCGQLVQHSFHVVGLESPGSLQPSQSRENRRVDVCRSVLGGCGDDQAGGLGLVGEPAIVGDESRQIFAKQQC